MTIYRFQCKHFPGGQIGWEHTLPNSNAPTKFVAVIALPSEAEHRTGAVVISDEFNVNEVSYGAIYV
ncbi:MAG: hypothetical protein JWR21_4439, partial [Herminiimonas sp.]|nr:hypothetical protein [Herminiimonas sp.]